MLFEYRIFGLRQIVTEHGGPGTVCVFMIANRDPDQSSGILKNSPLKNWKWASDDVIPENQQSAIFHNLDDCIKYVRDAVKGVRTMRFFHDKMKMNQFIDSIIIEEIGTGNFLPLRSVPETFEQSYWHEYSEDTRQKYLPYFVPRYKK